MMQTCFFKTLINTPGVVAGMDEDQRPELIRTATQLGIERGSSNLCHCFHFKCIWLEIYESSIR